MKSWYGLLVVIGILLAACGRSDAPQGSAPAEPVSDKPVVVQPVPALAQGEGTIVGEVLFKGAPPVPKRIAINKDKEACGDYKESEELVGGPNRGVKWAVVSVHIPGGVVQTKVGSATILDQRGCHFQPHVLLVPAGGMARILNPDGVLHNFHTYSKINPIF